MRGLGERCVDGFNAVCRILCSLVFITGLVLLASTSAVSQDNFVRPPMHGFSMGTYFEYTCPSAPKAVTVDKLSKGLLLGLRGYAGVWLDNVQAVCAQRFHQTSSTRGSGIINYTNYEWFGPTTESQLFGNRLPISSVKTHFTLSTANWSHC